MIDPPGTDWQWCPRCRTALTFPVRGGRPRPTCPACGFVHFANMGVGAAVVVRDDAGRVLLVQRGPGQFGAGKWCFPCGYVEWGEDPRVGAAREAKEESGLDVIVGEILQVAPNFHDPRRPSVGLWYAAERRDPTSQPTAGDDAVDAQWFDPATPPPLAFPTDAPLLARLAATAP